MRCCIVNSHVPTCGCVIIKEESVFIYNLKKGKGIKTIRRERKGNENVFKGREKCS